MKKLKLLTVPLIVVLLLGVSSLQAQGKFGEVGKLFTKQEAKVTFGKVIGTLTIKAQDLRKALEGAKDYVFFTIKNNRIVIRDENKNRLTEEDEWLDKGEPLYMFSKTMIMKLLQNGYEKADNSVQSTKAQVVYVEIRPEVLTLTAGDTTLELSLICPPICPN